MRRSEPYVGEEVALGVPAELEATHQPMFSGEVFPVCAYAKN